MDSGGKRNSTETKYADSHILECVEISIPIPYGHMAAKWWGRQDVRPIIALHGWQDNCGSFDKLIPQLPQHVGYLAIDLPGHGLSSFQPSGTVYGHVHYMYILNYVFRHHFKWEKVSILAHSMSSVISFVYTAVFPDYVDLLIGLDALKPQNITEGYVRGLISYLDGNSLKTDLNNMANIEPPSYTYDELIEKMVQSTSNSVDRESAPYLLQRGCKQSIHNKERYYFRRDNRLKMVHMYQLTSDINNALASRIRCPFLFIKALESPYSENQSNFQETLETLQRCNPLFELYGVEGGHHVHLTEPEKVSGKLTAFINRVRGSNGIHTKNKL